MNKVIVKALPKIDNAVLRDLFFKIGVQMVQTHQETIASIANGASSTFSFPEATLGGRVVDIWSGVVNGAVSTRQTAFTVVATHTQDLATKETTCTMTVTNNSGGDLTNVVVNIISF